MYGAIWTTILVAIKQCCTCFRPFPTLLRLPNAFLGSYVGLENQIAPYEPIFEHWPAMFQNVEH